MSQKKAQKKTEKKVVHHKISIGKIVATGFYVSLGILFLSVNLYASQMIHPLYGRLVNNETAAWVTFFKITRNNEKAEAYLYDVQGKYRDLQEEINQDNSTRLQMIANLEEILKLNPQSRDVLYAIATLYKESGDNEKAADYLKRAQQIDPLLML